MNKTHLLMMMKKFQADHSLDEEVNGSANDVNKKKIMRYA